MLIKYYSLQGNLNIIEDITDVTVPSGIIDGSAPISPRSSAWEEYIFDDLFHHDLVVKDPAYKEITFAKDGPKSLRVYGKAYICNNDGRTIEKVIPFPDIA